MDERDLIVLGAGSGSISVAIRAARHGARVTLLEPNAIGGTCVNVGCVPKKAMWIAAELAEAQAVAREVGFASAPGPLDWFVDDTLVGRDVRDGRLHWPLARGRHVIVVRDTAGRSARTHVDVR